MTDMRSSPILISAIRAKMETIVQVLMSADIDPTNIVVMNAILNLGIGLMEQGDKDKCIACLEQALHNLKTGGEVT